MLRTSAMSVGNDSALHLATHRRLAWDGFFLATKLVRSASSACPTTPSALPAETSGFPTAPSARPPTPGGFPTPPSARPTVPSRFPTARSARPTPPSVNPLTPSVYPATPSVDPIAPSLSPTAPRLLFTRENAFFGAPRMARNGPAAAPAGALENEHPNCCREHQQHRNSDRGQTQERAWLVLHDLPIRGDKNQTNKKEGR